MNLIITFLEDFEFRVLSFSAGDSIGAEYLGGGDVIHCRWRGVLMRLPISSVKVEW